MADSIQSLSRNSIEQLREMYQWWKRRPQSDCGGAAEPFTKFGPHLIRIGRTCTNDEFPTYPTGAANTFCVEFGYYDFYEEPGQQPLDFFPYEEPFIRVCRDLGGRYWEEGSLVACVLLRGKWVILSSTTNLIRFKMTSTMSLGGQATAIEIESGPGYAEVGEEFTIKDPWDEPGSWREDVHATPRAAGGGYRGWCIIPENPEEDANGDPIREIVWMEQLAERITFTLTANMSGGSAAATVNNYYRGKDPADVWPSGFTVYDPQGLFPRALNGCKGKATYNNRDHRYECTTCDQQALMIRGTLTDNMCSSTGSISSAVRITWPPYGKMPDPVPTSVTNPMALKGASGQEVFAVFNDTASEWQVWQVEHKSGAFVDTFGHDFDTDCGVLAATKKTIAYQECGESAAPDEVTLSEETVLVTDGDGGITSELEDTTATSGQAASQCQVVLTYRTLPICTIQRNHATTPTPTDVTLFQATPREVVDDVYVDGTAYLKQSKHWVYVVCWEDSGDETILDFTTECP